MFITFEKFNLILLRLSTSFIFLPPWIDLCSLGMVVASTVVSGRKLHNLERFRFYLLIHLARHAGQRQPSVGHFFLSIFPFADYLALFLRVRRLYKSLHVRTRSREKLVPPPPSTRSTSSWFAFRQELGHPLVEHDEEQKSPSRTLGSCCCRRHRINLIRVGKCHTPTHV